jgi:hypothetical protein
MAPRLGAEQTLKGSRAAARYSYKPGFAVGRTLQPWQIGKKLAGQQPPAPAIPRED